MAGVEIDNLRIAFSQYFVNVFMQAKKYVVYKSIAQAGEPSIAIRRQANMRGFRNNIFFAIILICLPECYTR